MSNLPSQLSCRQVNQWDLVDFLSSIGIAPARVSGHQYWYCSPLRTERTPSFKVDRRLNCWYDHGVGKGGTLIDFALLYYDCTIPQLLGRFSHAAPLSFQPQSLPPNGEPEVLKSIEVVGVLPLGSQTLLHYLKHRGIDVSIARKYCNEVQFKLHGRQYSAIGFRNDAGGYELRNLWFKGSTAPKAVTTLKVTLDEPEKLLVFEGFFDFLSYQTLSKKMPPAKVDCLVLNSLAFLQKSRHLMECYNHIALYLDRDASGLKATRVACAWSEKYKDESSLYKGHKDLNAKLEIKTKMSVKTKGPRL